LTPCDQLADSAARWAKCPICLDSLHSRPSEVGAFVCRGKRIESTLYHKSCVLDEAGKLRLNASLKPPWYTSPVSRRPVDGFRLLPPTSKPISWTKFVDWNGDGKVDVAELGTAIAAVLPIEEHHAEKLVSSRFDKDSNGFLDSKEIREHVLPYIKRQTARIVAKASRAPEIHSESSYQDMVTWFDYWDKEKFGFLTQSCLRLAVACCFECETSVLRQQLANIIVAEADVLCDEVVTRAVFQSRVVPVLKINLPEQDVGHSVKVKGSSYDPKQPFKIQFLSTQGKQKSGVVSASGNVEDLRKEARRQFRVWLGSRDADLCVAGRFLCDDSVLLLSLPVYLPESTIQVIPKVRVVLPRRMPAKDIDALDSDSSSGSFTGDCSCSIDSLSMCSNSSMS